VCASHSIMGVHEVTDELAEVETARAENRMVAREASRGDSSRRSDYCPQRAQLVEFCGDGFFKQIQRVRVESFVLVLIGFLIDNDHNLIDHVTALRYTRAPAGTS
jgi:hypothetical protein